VSTRIAKLLIGNARTTSNRSNQTFPSRLNKEREAQIEGLPPPRAPRTDTAPIAIASIYRFAATTTNSRFPACAIRVCSARHRKDWCTSRSGSVQTCDRKY